jgi:hypothetical protein
MTPNVACTAIRYPQLSWIHCIHELLALRGYVNLSGRIDNTQARWARKALGLTFRRVPPKRAFAHTFLTMLVAARHTLRRARICKPNGFQERLYIG